MSTPDDPTRADGVTPARRQRRPGWLGLAVSFIAGLAVAALLLSLWGPGRGADEVAAPGAGSSAEPTTSTDGDATGSTSGPTEEAAEEATDERPGEQDADDPRLAWAPPELEDPETIEVTEDNRGLELEPDQDYILELPDEPLAVRGGLSVFGGRNLVLIGGEIRIDERGEGHDLRGLYLQNQTGTVHVEGLLISGDGLGEGINLSQPLGAVVQLQNIRVEKVTGTQEGHHADVVQTWSGPDELRIDRLTGSTNYQGFFLLPMQFGDQDEPEGFDLRRIDLEGGDGAFMLWRDDRSWPLRTDEVWVVPSDPDGERDQFLWAKGDGTRDSWDDVQVGTPPGGSFVPEGVAGVGYESPGYVDGTDG